MTVPGVYSPSQGQQPDYVDDWGPITREQFDFVMTRLNDIGIVDAAAYDATIRAAAESDGVGKGDKIQALSHALGLEIVNQSRVEQLWVSAFGSGSGYIEVDGGINLDALAEAALNALRALEGED